MAGLQKYTATARKDMYLLLIQSKVLSLISNDFYKEQFWYHGLNNIQMVFCIYVTSQI